VDVTVDTDIPIMDFPDWGEDWPRLPELPPLPEFPCFEDFPNLQKLLLIEREVFSPLWEGKAFRVEGGYLDKGGREAARERAG
jgi:hypothetical protein